MAEDIGIEPISPFLNGGLANPCRTLQHIFQITILKHTTRTVTSGIILPCLNRMSHISVRYMQHFQELMCFNMAEGRGVEPHPLLAEPGFQGQSQDHPRCITFHW